MARHVWWLAVAGSIVLLLNISRFSYFHLPSVPSVRSRLHNSLETEAAAEEEELPYQDERAARSENLKPWPSVPSFLPWLPARSKLTPHSCEAYFGNSFTERIGVFSASVNPKEERCGSLQCMYSETLRTSICEGRNVVMHPERISMSPGGELVEEVIGRTDADELPSFSPGAFQIIVPHSRWSQEVADWIIPGKQLDVLLPQGQIHDHKLRSLFTSIRTASADGIPCSELQDQNEPTLLVTRYEYANLFHTATDWYSAYATSRVLGLEQRPHVIFVDGHCQSPMDDGWEALFSSVRYAKNLTGPVCFDHVIFTPLGYETAMFKGLNSGLSCQGCEAADLKQSQDDGKTARLREFGEVFKAAFGVFDRITDVKKILFVRRESYLAHPRHVGQPEIRLQNEQELFDAMEAWARTLSEREGRSVAIINGTLAHMKMKEQVQAVHDASIIVGVHGAGLTHILFGRPGTAVLELLSPLFPRPHYSHISQWMGVEYHSITMPGTRADCTQVVQRLSVILGTLWQ